MQPPFVAELARVLKPGGFLHVATDWADYARHTREVLAPSDAFRGRRAERARRRAARAAAADEIRAPRRAARPRRRRSLLSRARVA